MASPYAIRPLLLLTLSLIPLHVHATCYWQNSAVLAADDPDAIAPDDTACVRSPHPRCDIPVATALAMRTCSSTWSPIDTPFQWCLGKPCQMPLSLPPLYPSIIPPLSLPTHNVVPPSTVPPYPRRQHPPSRILLTLTNTAELSNSSPTKTTLPVAPLAGPASLTACV